MPQAVVDRCRLEAGTRRDERATPGRATRIDNGQARIIDTGVVVRKAVGITWLEARAQGGAGQALAARLRQAGLAAQKVIQKQAGADHPARPRMRLMRQHELQRFDQMRRCLEQHFALMQGLAYQAEFIVFEVAQAAMDQLGAPLRGRRSKIALLDQQHRQAAPGGVTRDAATIDATADDQQVNRRAIGGWQN